MSENKNSTKGYLDMQLLRFTTAGSVDDGKSTLIGRLLYDSKSIFEDQIEAIERTSKRRGDGGQEGVNLALLTDGLRAEREQGITIDVAYRYFATPKRKFIIADTPGHIQYTRNMVTGASTANLAIILIDARNGVIEQTLRHSYIASLLRIPHIVVCINKMDLEDYSEAKYNEIKNKVLEFAPKLNLKDIHFIPISALKGDNVVLKSTNMDWYKGETLMHLLENIPLDKDLNFTDARFPVQYVVRPQTADFPDYRGYAGRIESGEFAVGDLVKVLPSGLTSKIKSIDMLNQNIQKAFVPQSVTITIEKDIDISRGDMLVKVDNEPLVSQEITAMVCWFNVRPLSLRSKYAIKHNANEARCMIKSVDFKIDINTLEQKTENKVVEMNEIAQISLKTTKPLFYDSYTKNRLTGSFILIDEGTNETMAAGMIV